MPILNPNSTSYKHPWEPNLSDIHNALDYTEDGKPALRVLSNIQGDIVIEGDVNVPGNVKVENVVGTSLAVNDGGTPLQITGNVDVSNASVNFSDSVNLSAFSRLRTANTRLLGEFRNHYGTMGPVEILSHFESGGSETVNLQRTHTMINIGTAAGSRAVRQSRKYHSYIPGTTNLAFVSFTFGAPKQNLQQSVGLYDNLNGIFLRLNGSIPEMVIRKDGVDSEVVPQSQWNVDQLNGLGPSGVNIDLTKSQIFVCDYQWLGVGRVRVGFNINGSIVYTHYFNHTNLIDEPYTFQPSLPVRYEILNTGNTTSPSSMMCICYSVYVEGSDAESGFDNSVSTGSTSINLGAAPNNVKGLIAVRLRSSVNGIDNRALARLKSWEVVTNLTAQYRVMILKDSSDIAGAPSWTNATPTGWCEYTTNFSLTSPLPAGAVVLYDGFATGGSNRGVATTEFADNRSSAIYQNFDSSDSMIFVVVGYRLGNDNAEMRASLSWIEVK